LFQNERNSAVFLQNKKFENFNWLEKSRSNYAAKIDFHCNWQPFIISFDFFLDIKMNNNSRSKAFAKIEIISEIPEKLISSWASSIHWFSQDTNLGIFIKIWEKNIWENCQKKLVWNFPKIRVDFLILLNLKWYFKMRKNCNSEKLKVVILLFPPHISRSTESVFSFNRRK